MILDSVWPVCVSRALALAYVLISLIEIYTFLPTPNFFFAVFDGVLCVYTDIYIYIFYCLYYGRRTEIIHVLLHSAIISQMWRCGKMTASNSEGKKQKPKKKIAKMI